MPDKLRTSHYLRSLRILAVVWIGVGIETFLDPPGVPGGTFPLEVIPPGARGTIWIGAALCALVLSVWPPGADRRGFSILLIPAALRTFSYAWAAVVAAGAGHHRTAAESLLDTVMWGIVMVFVLHEASTVEPPNELLDTTERA